MSKKFIAEQIKIAKNIFYQEQFKKHSRTRGSIDKIVTQTIRDTARYIIEKTKPKKKKGDMPYEIIYTDHNFVCKELIKESEVKDNG